MSEAIELPPIVNLRDVEFTLQQQGEHYAAQHATLGARLGSQKLGSQLVIVPPGKRAWPYHAHFVNEELFFILAGEGVLHMGDKEYLLSSGDLISIPPGPEYAHELINTSDTEEFTYLSISTMEEPDIVFFPETDEVTVIAGAPPGGDLKKANLYFTTRLQKNVAKEDDTVEEDA